MYMLQFVLMLVCARVCESRKLKDIHIMGLFPVTGSWDRGRAIQPAALMAVDDINKRKDLLPGYRLNMHANDTMCNAGLGVKALADQVCQPPVKLLIVGAGCSTVSQATAQVSHRWNLLQVSYISVSPALSDRRRYPNFLRVVVSESMLNEARMELLKHYNWKRVATLHEDFQIFSTMIEDIIKRLKEDKFEIAAQVVFSEDPTTAISRLKDADVRIIVAGFYPNKAKKVLCTAYKAGFYGKHVWITTTTLSHNKWFDDTSDIDCTTEEILKVLNGTLVFHNVFTNPDPDFVGFTNVSLRRFRERLEKRIDPSVPRPVSGSNRACNGYDSVWAAAIALNKTINHLKDKGSPIDVTDFTYENKEMTELMRSKFLEVDFKSVSGHVSFDKNGDGIRLVGIQRIEGREFKNVGHYDKRKAVGEMLYMQDIYHGNVPSDGNQTIKVPFTLSMHQYVTMITISSFGILLSVTFLIFNIRYRNIKIIRLSSPSINNIILLGCIFAFLSVFIEDIHQTGNSIFCKVKIYLLLLAFSLAFGALFAKTWRIYTIFTASLQMKKRSIQDFTLYLMIGGLVALNSIVIIVWFVVDPQKIVTQDILDKRDIKGDLVIQYTVSYCWSDKQSYFLVTILVIQGILLLLGVFLAWETRRVTFSTLNESHYIGMCIYNQVALGVVGVLVSYSIRNDTPLVYIVVSTITILCTTVTECLLFIPKILAFRKFLQGKLKDTAFTSTNDQFRTLKSLSKASQTDSEDYF